MPGECLINCAMPHEHGQSNMIEQQRRLLGIFSGGTYCTPGQSSSGILLFFAAALKCEGLDQGFVARLVSSNWPIAKLSPGCGQPFQP